MNNIPSIQLKPHKLSSRRRIQVLRIPPADQVCLLDDASGELRGPLLVTTQWSRSQQLNCGVVCNRPVARHSDRASETMIDTAGHDGADRRSPRPSWTSLFHAANLSIRRVSPVVRKVRPAVHRIRPFVRRARELCLLRAPPSREQTDFPAATNHGRAANPGCPLVILIL